MAPRFTFLIGISVFVFVLVVETLSQINVGKYAVTTLMFAHAIAATGHLGSVPAQQPTTWASFEWIDSALPVPAILVAQLGLLTGAGQMSLGLIPICMPFLVGFYALAIKMTRKTWFALFYVFVYLFFTFGFLGFGLINRTSLGFAYFGFLLLLLFTQRKGDRKSTVLITIILAANAFTYYTTALYAVAVMVGLAIYSMLAKRVNVVNESNSSFEISPTLVGMALAFLFGTSIVQVVIRSGFRFANLHDFLAAELNSLTGSLLYALHLAPAPVNPLLNTVPLPVYLQYLRPIETLATGLVVLSVGSLAVIGLGWFLTRNQEMSSRFSLCVAGSWAAVLMGVAAWVSYGPLAGTDSIIYLGLIGFIFLYLAKERIPHQSKIGRASKIVLVSLVILLCIASTVEVAIGLNVGFVGTHPNDDTLYQPISDWYGEYSTSSDIATASVVLSSLMALQSTNGQAIQTFQYNLAISSALASSNSTELKSSLNDLSANVYALAVADETRPSWGDVWGYITPSMNYSTWFYTLPFNNIVYNNGATLVDYVGAG